MIIIGTPSDDEIYGGFDSDVIYGLDGSDILGGGSGSDILNGGGGVDWLFGDSGDDMLIGGFGADRLYGGLDTDTADYRGSASGVIASLATGHGYSGTAQGDSYFSIENLFGSIFDDVLYGNDLANRLDGYFGNDFLIGYGGNDTLSGGPGGDAMYGGLGSDTYFVDNAADFVSEDPALFGGANGVDHVFTSVSFSLSNPAAAAGNIEHLTLTGISNVNGTGNALANTITGNGGNNVLNGVVGADLMRGGGGNDNYFVDNAGDVVDEGIVGSAGTDTVSSYISFSLANPAAVHGAVENLVLLGAANLNGTGNALGNTIVGNAGANTIDGLAGRDILTGGADNDIFRFAAASHSLVANPDVITDFDDFGDDRIDVSGLYGPAMTYRHNLAFTAAGQLRINDIAGADVIVEVNTSGTLAADFAIRLADTTLASMTASDFFL